jgi:hypothetical protein
MSFLLCAAKTEAHAIQDQTHAHSHTTQDSVSGRGMLVGIISAALLFFLSFFFLFFSFFYFLFFFFFTFLLLFFLFFFFLFFPREFE